MFALADLVRNAVILISRSTGIGLSFPTVILAGDLLAPDEVEALVLNSTASATVIEEKTRLIILASADGATLQFDDAALDQVILEGGVVASLWTDAPVTAPRAARHCHDYVLRRSAGLIVQADEWRDAAVVTLRGPPSINEDVLQISLWTNALLQPLPTGLYPFAPAETNAESGGLIAERHAYRADRALAAGLAGRLLAMETAFIDQAVKTHLLSEAVLNPGGGPRRDLIDAPQVRHEWRLAGDDTCTQEKLGLYDRRPDDAVILEARQGAAFFERYAPETGAPDFAGSVNRLNALHAERGEDERPVEVSVVIPVYGQLPFTLNCIESLLLHACKRRMEVIVIDDCSTDGVTARYLPLVAGISYHRQEQNGGFIASCNTGGSYAVGDFIVMLNNDTRVAEGWLDHLIGSFETLANAGLVGSKMLYPDGTLQEAGGVLWRNGDAWNYGRNDDPNRPQYCFAREVDYISGCSLALRTSVWRALGGFDPFYTPAYAEDADLCQRIKQQGLAVWYQPASRVIHYEGKTSGTSTAGGVKAYQLLNLKKLFYRWRRELEHHRPSAQDLYLEKERKVRRRLLVIDAVTPTPDQDAGSVQTFLAIKSAQALGYKVHFAPEDNWLYEPGYTDALMRLGVECAYAPYELGLEAYLARYGSLFDAVMVYRVGVLSKAITALRTLTDAVVIFHVADLHHIRMQRQAELDHNDAGLAAAQKMKRLEFDLIERTDCTVTHSTFEVSTIKDENPDAPVVYWPLMMETMGTGASYPQRRDICFLGGYRHPPNIDAVETFLADVFPLIRALIPGIRVHIAGSHMPPSFQDLASKDVVIVGHVEALSDLFDKVRCFVCPLRVGAGAKGKVVSAMAHGLPVISTSIGVEGTGFVDGTDVLIADEPNAFAESVVKAYTDETVWTALSMNGLRIVQNEFSPEAGAQRLEAAITAGLQRKLALPFAS